MRTKLLLCLSLAIALPMSHASVCYAQVNELERTAPEPQGVPSDKVIEYFDYITSLKTTEIHSALLMRHGKVIGEIHPRPFAQEYGHTLFSCSKTFTAAAIGIAVSENRLRLDDRLAVFFPDQLPDNISDRLSQITIKDLLTMRSGFRQTDRVRTSDQEWVKSYLANEITGIPGKDFTYDSMNTYLLSAIIQKVTGMTMLDYLKQKLFARLNIVNVSWEYSPEGITCGGWGLHLQTESLAKFGQLLLNKGKWNGVQIIPESWVNDMMYPHVDLGKDNGYCYQMWKCAHPNTARADGAYGQFIIVMPDEDMVAVITQSITGDAGTKEQDYLFENILPNISSQPLNTGKSYAKLLKKQNEYTLPYAEGGKKSKDFTRYADKEYQLEKNNIGWKSFSLKKDNDGIILTVKTEKAGTNEVKCGHMKWSESTVAYKFPLNARGTTLGAFSGSSSPQKSCGSYGWADNATLNIKALFVEWMSGIDITMHFDGDNVSFQYKENYSSSPSTVKGKVVE